MSGKRICSPGVTFFFSPHRCIFRLLLLSTKFLFYFLCISFAVEVYEKHKIGNTGKNEVERRWFWEVTVEN